MDGAVQDAVFYLVFFQKIVVVIVLAGHLAIEAVTLRSKQPSLKHTYRTKKGSTLTSLFEQALGGSKFSQGGPNFAGKFVPGGTYFRGVQILRDSTLIQYP